MLNGKLSIPKKIYYAIKYAYSNYERDAYMKSQKYFHLGKESIVEDGVIVSHPDRLHIGNFCRIQSGVKLHSMGGISIGDNVGIGYGTIIVSFIHNYNYCKKIPYDETIFLKPVNIQNYVWIGWNVKINPGVEIGEGTIVGMGAVVTSDTPPLSIVIGNPAKVVGYRSKDAYYKCKEDKSFHNHFIKEFDERIPLMVKRKHNKLLKYFKII